MAKWRAVIGSQITHTKLPFGGHFLLVSAVIKRAAQDLLLLDDEMREDAWDWFHSFEEHEPWSFSWCCKIVGAKPDEMRREVIERVNEESRSIEFWNGWVQRNKVFEEYPVK